MRAEPASVVGRFKDFVSDHSMWDHYRRSIATSPISCPMNRNLHGPGASSNMYVGVGLPGGHLLVKNHDFSGASWDRLFS